MPKCATCSQFLHPDYSILINENKKDFQCIFCYLEKDVVTIQDDKLKKEIIIKKSEAIENYRKFINDLYKAKKIQDLVNPKSNIIKP